MSLTSERLSEIQGRYAKWPADKLPTMHDGLTAISDAASLVRYIELLHERLNP